MKNIHLISTFFSGEEKKKRVIGSFEKKSVRQIIFPKVIQAISSRTGS